MNTLATTISGEGLGNKSVIDSLDRLASILARIEADDRSFIEKQAHNILGIADARVSGFLSKAGERLVSFVGDPEVLDANATVRDHAIDKLRKSASLMAGLVDANRGKAVASELTSLGNMVTGEVWQPLIKMMNEVFGITDENRAIYELVNKVKAGVSAVRQEFREKVPEILAEQFSRKLTNESGRRFTWAWARPTSRPWATPGRPRASGRCWPTRLSSTGRSPTPNTGSVRRSSRRRRSWPGSWCGGEIDPSNQNLLRNAYAIAKLARKGTNSREMEFSETTVQAIDELVSLYALKELDDGTRKTLVELTKSETKGMDFHHLPRQPAAEGSGQGRSRGRSGPVERLEGAHPLRSARRCPAGREARQREQAAPEARLHPDRGLPGLGRGRLRPEGVLLLDGGGLEHLPSGRDADGADVGLRGGSENRPHARWLHRWPRCRRDGGVVRNRLEANQGRSRRSGEPLLPIYGEEGEVVGYERSMAPEKLAALSRNTHLGQMAGPRPVDRRRRSLLRSSTAR